MLTAITGEGKVVSLLDETFRKQVTHSREHMQFYCSACGGKLMLKLGAVRVWHFAHTTVDSCHAHTEGESDYHLQGKRQLYEYFLNRGYPTMLEPYVEEIRQRPDLLIEGRKPMAVEFQCATVPRQLIITRTESFQSMGIRPLWILGANRMNRLHTSVFRISAFDWTFLYPLKRSPVLLYYCPQTNYILTLSHLLPFSIQTTIAHLAIKSLHPHKPLSDSKVDSSSHLHAAWLQQKRKWRTHAGMFSSPLKHRIASLLYEHGIVLCYIPAEIGIPLPSLYVIETQAVMWQAWVWLTFIKPLPLGGLINFKHVEAGFRKELAKGLFRLRQLPMIQKQDFSAVLAEYFQALTQLGILYSVSADMFRKDKNLQEFQTLETAFIRDEEVIKVLEGRRDVSIL